MGGTQEPFTVYRLPFTGLIKYGTSSKTHNEIDQMFLKVRPLGPKGRTFGIVKAVTEDAYDMMRTVL
jgi:hypothetical protein